MEHRSEWAKSAKSTSFVNWAREACQDPRFRHSRVSKPIKFIAAAAIKSDYDNVVHSVPVPGRHHDVIRIMVGRGYPTPIRGTQGFILNTGKFVDRKAARKVAEAAGQLLDRASDSDELFSEDVWRGFIPEGHQYK
jgi:hypothetical protein